MKTDLLFPSKGLHMSNLNIRHIVPKIDELRIALGAENGPDILGICETFLDQAVSDEHLHVSGFEFFRKDRCETKDKSGGGLMFYFRKSLNCKRRADFETSHIETIWSEVTVSKSKLFLFVQYTVRQVLPPNG